jgi:predicted ATPase
MVARTKVEVSPSEALGEEDALVLGSLVEQSMVVAEPARARYGMLEPVRQYALEKLEAAGEADAVRELHSRYFLALAERAGPELRGSDGRPGWRGSRPS